jgi:hypothetical protein
MRFAAVFEDDRPDNDAAFAREAFAALANDAVAWLSTFHLCLVVRGGGRSDLLIVLVGDGDALEGGFKVGNLHCAKCSRD